MLWVIRGGLVLVLGCGALMVVGSVGGLLSGEGLE